MLPDEETSKTEHLYLGPRASDESMPVMQSPFADVETRRASTDRSNGCSPRDAADNSGDHESLPDHQPYTLEERTKGKAKATHATQDCEASLAFPNKPYTASCDSYTSSVHSESSETPSSRDLAAVDGSISDTLSVIRNVGHLPIDPGMNCPVRGMDGVAELETISLPNSPCPAYNKQGTTPPESQDQPKKSIFKTARQYFYASWWLSAVVCLVWLAVIDLLHGLVVLEAPVGVSWYAPSRIKLRATGDQDDDDDDFQFLENDSMTRRHAPLLWEMILWSLLIGGRVLGALLAPRLVRRFGYPKLFSAAAAMILLLIPLLMGSVFASSASALQRFILLATGEFLLAIPFGIVSVLAIPYVSDVVSLRLRGTVLSMLSWVFATSTVFVVISSAALRTPSIQQSRFVYTLMFIFALICAAGSWYIPESPRYTVQRQRITDVDSPELPAFPFLGHSEQDNEAAVVALQLLDEKEASLFGRGLLACFRKPNRKRTFALAMVYYTTLAVGLSAYGLTVALVDGGGFATAGAYVHMIAAATCGVGASIISLLLVRHIGRRSMWIAGLWLLVLISAVIFAQGNPLHGPSRLKDLYGPSGVRHGRVFRSITAFLYLAFVTFAAVLPALSCVLSAEIPAGHLMVETVAVSGTLSTILLVMTIAGSWLLFSWSSWKVTGKPALLLRGMIDSTASVAFGWILACLCGLVAGRGRPETKDKSAEEVNRSYEVLYLIEQRQCEHGALGAWAEDEA